jgi:uncharacterized membrane protein YozB (DUF420 family)
MIALEAFPGLNATLNAVATVLITTGLVLIRNGRRDAHRLVMLAAVATSTAFLACYLYYHFHHGSTPFAGQGSIRTLYFTILLSHTILAAAVPFLVVTTVFFALRGNFERHRRVAKWTAPIWLYVSVTGVVIYWMLYRM